MSFIQKVLHRAPAALVRLAAVLTLVALAIMAFSIVVPKPLPIVLAMSVGQLIGLTGFGIYFLAVLIDVAKRTRPPADAPPSSLTGAKRDDPAS